MGREDYTLFKVMPALRSVINFEFTQSTYAKVASSSKAIWPAGSSMFDFCYGDQEEEGFDGNDFDQSQRISPKKTNDVSERMKELICINSVGDMQ